MLPDDVEQFVNKQKLGKMAGNWVMEQELASYESEVNLTGSPQMHANLVTTCTPTYFYWKGV